MKLLRAPHPTRLLYTNSQILSFIWFERFFYSLCFVFFKMFALLSFRTKFFVYIQITNETIETVSVFSQTISRSIRPVCLLVNWWHHSWFISIDNASMNWLHVFMFDFLWVRVVARSLNIFSKTFGIKRSRLFFAAEFAHWCGTSVVNGLFLREREIASSYAFATLSMPNNRVEPNSQMVFHIWFHALNTHSSCVYGRSTVHFLWQNSYNIKKKTKLTRTTPKHFAKLEICCGCCCCCFYSSVGIRRNSWF